MYATLVASIIIDHRVEAAFPKPPEKIIEVVEAPKEAKIEVVRTPKGIEREIRETFPEQPELALAVFRCESSLKQSAVSHTGDYGVAQINSASWDGTAHRLGYGDYKTNVTSNLKMARHIYDGAGKRFTDWVCYNRKMY